MAEKRYKDDKPISRDFLASQNHANGVFEVCKPNNDNDNSPSAASRSQTDGVNSPPVEGWQAPPDGVVSVITEEHPPERVVSASKPSRPTGEELLSTKGTEAPTNLSLPHPPHRKSINYFNLPYNPTLKPRARALRKTGNLVEVLFWNQVKNKLFKGLDFDRQKIIGNYIVDFYCANCQVVIEIDGKYHDNTIEYDTQRDAYLQSLELTIIRIPAIDILKRLSVTMEWLWEHPAFSIAPGGKEVG